MSASPSGSTETKQSGSVDGGNSAFQTTASSASTQTRLRILEAVSSPHEYNSTRRPPPTEKLRLTWYRPATRYPLSIMRTGTSALQGGCVSCSRSETFCSRSLLGSPIVQRLPSPARNRSCALSFPAASTHNRSSSAPFPAPTFGRSFMPALTAPGGLQWCPMGKSGKAAASILVT